MDKMKGPNTMVIFGVLYCCFVLMPFASCNQQKPVISHISEEQIKEIGEEVEFNCTVQHTGNYPILWMKLDKARLLGVPLSSKDTLIIFDQRYSVKFDTTTSTYSLKIKDLQETDTGYYQCQVLVDVNNKVSAEVELQIRRPPTINPNTTSSVNVTEGQQIQLTCNADGFPVPRISWKRENDLLLPSTGAIYRGNDLIIPKAHRDDRGVYYCIAENGVGVEARANATVRVSFAPIITALRPRVGQAQGYDVNLECKIEAHPTPTVNWYKNGKEITTDAVKTDRDEFVSTLTRYSIGSSDFGEYVCKAENKYGLAQTKVELFETSIPICANSCG